MRGPGTPGGGGGGGGGGVVTPAALEGPQDTVRMRPVEAEGFEAGDVPGGGE